jgi:hypothetical protein
MISPKHWSYRTSRPIGEDCPYGGRDREQLPANRRLFPIHIEEGDTYHLPISIDIDNAVDQGDTIYDAEEQQANMLG